MSERPSKEQMQTAFKKFDKDGSGYLNHAEVKEALAEIYADINYPFSDADVTAMINMADTQNDGKIQIEEFVNLY